MAAHLERHPGARAVVNFVPILLEQLDDYSVQIAQYLETRESVRVARPVACRFGRTRADHRFRCADGCCSGLLASQ